MYLKQSARNSSNSNNSMAGASMATASSGGGFANINCNNGYYGSSNSSNITYNNNNIISSPLTTPKSATHLKHGIHNSGSSHTTINAQENSNSNISNNNNSYKPIPSPFDTSSSSFAKSPILQMMMKSPKVNKKASTSSFTSIIPKKIRSNSSTFNNNNNNDATLSKGKKLKNKLSDLDLHMYKRTSGQNSSSLNSQPPPVPKSMPSLSDVGQISNGHQMYQSLQHRTIGSSLQTQQQAPLPYAIKSVHNQTSNQVAHDKLSHGHSANHNQPSNSATSATSASKDRQNLKDKNFIICDEKLEMVLQTSPTQVEKIIELRCGCFCHEDCLRSSVQFEKEKSMTDLAVGNKGLNYNKLPLAEKAFPICFHCEGTTKAVPKSQDLMDEFITEYVTYEPKPALIKNIAFANGKSATAIAVTNSFSVAPPQRPATAPSAGDDSGNADISTFSGSPGTKLNVNTSFLSNSPSHNPYQNINSPSSTYNKSLPYIQKQSLNTSNQVVANNPYIQNTLNGIGTFAPRKDASSAQLSSRTNSVNNVSIANTPNSGKPASMANTINNNADTAITPTQTPISRKQSNPSINQGPLPIVTRKKPTTNIVLKGSGSPLANNKKHHQFQFQVTRQAPLPPISINSAELRQQHISRLNSKASSLSLGSSRRTSPSKRLQSDNTSGSSNSNFGKTSNASSGSVSPAKQQSSSTLQRNKKNNLFIDIPTAKAGKVIKNNNGINSNIAGTSDASSKRRSMHNFSYEILNQQSSGSRNGIVAVSPTSASPSSVSMMSNYSNSKPKAVGTMAEFQPPPQIVPSTGKLKPKAKTKNRSRSRTRTKTRSKQYSIYTDSNRSRGSSVSAVSSVVSSVSRSPSPTVYDFRHNINSNYSNSNTLSRSNSLSSSYSLLTTSNTYSQHSTTDGEDDEDDEDSRNTLINNRKISLTTLREKFVAHLRNTLLDKTKNEEFDIDDTTLLTFGELRLVDRLLISVNTIDASKFSDKIVYLFKYRLLLIDVHYDSFISLKLDPIAKSPKMEISSTSIIKLDFSADSVTDPLTLSTSTSTRAKANRNRNINAVYISIEESMNDVIQKWAGAMCDYECSFPPEFFTSTLLELANKFFNEGQQQQQQQQQGLLVSSPIGDSGDVNTGSGIVFQHNTESQSTLNVIDRRSARLHNSYNRLSNSSVFSDVGANSKTNDSRNSKNTRASFRESNCHRAFKTTPQSLLFFVNIDQKSLSDSHKSLLINIMKTLLFKIGEIEIVKTIDNFETHIGSCSDVSDTQLLDLFGKSRASSIDSDDESFNVNSYIEKFLQSHKLVMVQNKHRHPDIGVLLLSTAEIVSPPPINFTVQKSYVQVGFTLGINYSKKQARNLHHSNGRGSSVATSYLPNSVVSVPVWDNLMEAICKGFHISFDNDSSSGVDESESESDSSESDDVESDIDVERNETTRIDFDEIRDKKPAEQAHMHQQTQLTSIRTNSIIVDNGHVVVNSGDESEENSEENDSSDNESDYDSDDSTKEQLLKLKEEGLLKDDALLGKHNVGILTHELLLLLQSPGSNNNIGKNSIGNRDSKYGNNNVTEAVFNDTYDNNSIDDYEYVESSDSDSGSDSEFDSDDSTKEQLQRINQNELLRSLDKYKRTGVEQYKSDNSELDDVDLLHSTVQKSKGDDVDETTFRHNENKLAESPDEPNNDELQKFITMLHTENITHQKKLLSPVFLEGEAAKSADNSQQPSKNDQSDERKKDNSSLEIAPANDSRRYLNLNNIKSDNDVKLDNDTDPYIASTVVITNQAPRKSSFVQNMAKLFQNGDSLSSMPNRCPSSAPLSFPLLKASDPSLASAGLQTNTCTNKSATANFHAKSRSMNVPNNHSDNIHDKARSIKSSIVNNGAAIPTAFVNKIHTPASYAHRNSSSSSSLNTGFLSKNNGSSNGIGSGSGSGNITKNINTDDHSAGVAKVGVDVSGSSTDGGEPEFSVTTPKDQIIHDVGAVGGDSTFALCSSNGDQTSADQNTSSIESKKEKDIKVEEKGAIEDSIADKKVSYNNTFDMNTSNDKPTSDVNNTRSPTPRWSVLFQGIDKEWESLQDDDEGYSRYSKWKTLSMNGSKADDPNQ